MIPWDDIEEEYADLFPSGCGIPAKPQRMALGALLIQKKYDYSDRELVEQIQENPYYQYFIGLPGFQLEQPFAPSLLVEFGAKLDLSVENGLGRIEKISFEAYNESEVLIPAIENYYKRNGHYPERVLADKIYRNRINSAVDHLNESGQPAKAFFVPKIDFDFFKVQLLLYFMRKRRLKKSASC